MELEREHLYHSFSVFCDELPWIEEQALKQSQFSDLTLKELRTVDKVAELQQSTARRLADELHLTPGTLTVTVDRLVKKGYALRMRDDYDRRVVRIKLTRRGRTLFRAYRAFQVQVLKSLVDEMDGEEVKSVEHGLGRVLTMFGQRTFFKMEGALDD
ncbi:MarR family winged helix-turn-helix transcriptional regulator [Lactobacillus corticis]|uniref:MarR family transcriptional regulator n=1 Tax=Lactobacillus corticis TaxID=2201249 RepID=A0A916VIY6_9LACO|nr:MarR family transcriptional regulator [Lactobacillus corticis]GFZ26594.1 MarR family transcriptional regulator [Lactobacillus corticis]